MTEETKICINCGDKKIITDFPLRNKTSRRNQCKKCHNRKYNKSRPQYKKKYRYQTREFVYEYLLSHPCVDCGEADPIVLEFDHVSGDKKSDISRMINNRFSPRKLMSEIAKCEVRCANCHRRKTARDFAWFKDLIAKPTSLVAESERE